MQTQNLAGGFDNAPYQSALAFRAAMLAMAQPGTIERISGAVPPKGLSVAAGTLILTLCDPETPVHLAGDLDVPEIRDWLRFHTGAPIVPPEEAMFAVGRWSDLTPTTRFPVGTPEYPDRSATLIVEMGALAQNGAGLEGPGIKTRAAFSLPEIDAFVANAALFPLGCDFYFTCADQLVGLPRTTKVEGQPCT